MSNFVDPTPPNNVQQNLSLLVLFCFFGVEGFDTRETVIDGISLEIEPATRSGKWMVATT